MSKLHSSVQKFIVTGLLLTAGVGTAFAEQPLEPLRGAAVDQAGSDILEAVRGVVRSSSIVRMASDQILTVRKFDLHAGDLVEKGQLLLAFNCDREQIMLKKARSEYSSAKVIYASQQKMYEYGQAGKAAATAAFHEMEGKGANIEQVKEMLSRCNVLAPFYGRVNETNINEGEMARPGEPMFALERLDQLELVFIVPSNYLSNIVVGSKIYVTIDEINKTLTAEVTQQLPVIDPVSQSSRIIAKLKSIPQDLRPGMSGNVSFKTVEASAQ